MRMGCAGAECGSNPQQPNEGDGHALTPPLNAPAAEEHGVRGKGRLNMRLMLAMCFLMLISGVRVESVPITAEAVWLTLPDAELEVRQPLPERPDLVLYGYHIVTQFDHVRDNGSVGLYAHSDQAGKYFYHLHIGDRIRVRFADGKEHVYVVVSKEKFVALDPPNIYSDFVDEGGLRLTSTELAEKWDQPNAVVLITCIEHGRLAVTARMWR